MSRHEIVRHRLFWPAAAMLTSIGIYLAHQSILDATRPDIEAHAIRMLSGALSYFTAAWLGGRLIGIALERVGPNRRRVPRLLQELVSVALFIAAAIATIILVFGQSVSGALAGSGLVLAILGFAVRNALADVLSGIALGLEAPYRIGDWVEIDSTVRGRIVEIGWRTTRLLTRDDTYTILPNSQIARQRLTNYSAPRRRYRTKIQILLGHDVPVAVASTLVTNPVTFGPIYYAAWRVGSTILGEPVHTAPPPTDTVTQDEPSGESWWRTTSRRVLGVGKPLLVGLAVLATAVGITTYFLVSAVWKMSVLWKRHRRRRR